MESIHEIDGISLQVNYERINGVPNFDSIRVLDENYLPIGPDLQGLFSTLFRLVSNNSGENVLSIIAGELA